MGVRFSSRFEYPFVSNGLFELASSLGEGCINLTVSNPTSVGLVYDRQMLDSFLRRENFTYSPDPRGLAAARDAVAGYYINRRKLSISRDDIFITAGTGDAYAYLFKLLCDAGDNVLVPAPGYPLFDHIAGLELVELRHYELEYSHLQGWDVDFYSLEALADDRTKAVVLVNPNNPTGSYVSVREADRLAAFAADRGLALIVDEVFFDFSVSDSCDAASFAGRADCLSFTLSGFSKVLGLPQMKFSWIVVSGPDAAVAEACDRLELISDTYLSASVPVQNAAPLLFDFAWPVFEQIYRRVRHNFAWLEGFFADSPLRVLRLEGGWSCVLELPRIMSEDMWVKRLVSEAGVFVFPGYFFDFPKEAYVVVSLLVEPSVMRKGMERIVAFCKKEGLM